MFSEQKWNILKCLSHEKLSPLQLAERLNTTMANISQQLRLLEAANLVKKEKIKNRDRGKPRALFSLSEDFVYLIPAMNSFADKKLLHATTHHKTILKIWFLKNQELHEHIEKLYWKIKPYLSHIHAIAVNQAARELIIISDKLGEMEKTLSKNSEVTVKIFSAAEAQKAIRQGKEPFSSSELSVIYEYNSFISKNYIKDS